jgi:prepilin-type N-terminal cleavage/methylation domain-containing protein
MNSMKTSCAATRRRSAFTLIEVSAVVLIMGLLSGIMIVGAVKATSDTEAQQATLALASVTAVQADFAARYGGYTAWAADLRLPDGPFVTNGPSEGLRSVSLALGVDGTLGMAVSDRADQCVLQTIRPVVAGGQVWNVVTSDAGVGCLGSTALESNTGLTGEGARTLTTPESRIP